MRAILKARGVVKSFGRSKALDGFDFIAYEGETVALIGPNGAGKTTFFRILAKYLKEDGGEVLYWGKARGREVLSAICYLPENPAFPEGIKVKELLSIHASFYHAENEVSELIERFDLAGWLGKSLGSLSKGLRRRAFAAASLLNYKRANLIILDEPFDGLDPETVVNFREFINQQRGKRTVLLSSHSLANLPKVTDRIVFIRKGKAVAEVKAKGKTGDEIEAIYLEITRGEK